ncbi:glycosyltransferase [Ilumatobacter sp.]|uniref:glycosyltransferase n=1 Tax=Ilumatobacter sp. TaxID=1967498 RepID=UPI003AF8770B
MLYLVTSDISARFLRGQLAHLIERGFEVAVGAGLSDPPAVFDEGVEVHDLPLVRNPSPLADLRGLIAVLGLIRRTRPTIVNASTPKAGLLGMIASWLLRVPKRVYVVRGLRFETANGISRHALRSLERVTTACATDVVYNSRSLLAVAERERAVGTGRGVVLAGGSGNGIDAEHFDELPTRHEARRVLGLAHDTKVIGFVGRLTRDKGIVDLVEAFRSLDDDTVLLLVGDFETGDPVPDTTRRVIENDDRIVQLPWIDDTRSIYPAIDVLAFPSAREGLPNVPLEAQLCGVPVVAYAATGTVDAVFPGPPNRSLPVGDRDGLTAALRSSGGGAPSPEPADWVRRNFDRERIWGEIERLLGARS